MPVILDPDVYHLWLDPGSTEVAAVSAMLKSYDARLKRCYPVSTKINHPANDDAECAKPLEIEAPPARPVVCVGLRFHPTSLRQALG